jgi:para-nitrobenzyl esterase
MRLLRNIFLIAGLTCLPACAYPATDRPVRKPASGPVLGKTSADGQVDVFLGISYAAPPTGSLRWKPPQPAPAWKEVREATAFGSRCMQARIYDDMVFRDPGISEDCLTLNIWAPAGKNNEHLPVMVWIYGGGFVAGSTSEPRQDGENLARKGVIVVSMNYRLGIFGFFATQELAKESPQHAAGNYGLMDQATALQWVHKNISAFGGDPKNITIFGESAGSFSVSALMASPLSRNLISHAIGESGGGFGQSSGTSGYRWQRASENGGGKARRRRLSFWAGCRWLFSDRKHSQHFCFRPTSADSAHCWLEQR